MAALHPIIVHFVIALLVVGVIFRLISLTGKLAFTGPAGATLLIAGAAASVFAVMSGDKAHPPAERIPGVRPAVQEHEEWGERTRNLFLVIGALEVAALALKNERFKRGALIASGVLGLPGLFAVYETGEHGGELVYSYAGGVGTRTGDSADVERLLLAGLFHQATRDREAGRSEAAQRLMDEMAVRFPDDAAVQLLHAESLLRDRNDPGAALDRLARIDRDAGGRFVKYRAGMLEADVLMAMDSTDRARDVLRKLLEAFPGNRRIEKKLEIVR